MTMDTNDSRTEGRIRKIKRPLERTDAVFSLNRNDKCKQLIINAVKTHLIFKRTKEEVTDIKTSVEEVVDKFSNCLGEKFELDISHKYLVGSMAENTRMNEPDEFDFILVLNNYTEDVIETKICEQHPGEGMHPYLRLKNEINTNIELDYENKFYSIKTYIDTEMKQIVIEKHSGTLVWKRPIPYHQGPAMTCIWEWIPKEGTSLKISVDIVLAIERRNVSDVVTADNVSYSKYLPYLEEYFIIKQLYKTEPDNKPSSKQFKYTFTTTELKLMNDEHLLSDYHKTCFIFLKFLFGQGCRKKPSSYQMKILTLKHAADCEADTVDMIGCLEDILTRLDHLFRTEHDKHETTKQSLFLSDVSLLSKKENAGKSSGVLENIQRIISILNSLTNENDVTETSELFQQLSVELSKNIL